ncbi:protein kinase [Amycolatopsis halotolerans]|uniref:Protein kinase n=1 Tax=Amycolatopsis halotolerans TaxID=330083 RepID=A0ABV7QNR3_9PSEU
MLGAGETVDPRELYRLSARPLGKGGYAQVWRAEHKESGQEVALKRALQKSDAYSRIKREIQAQQSLAHPNIMPIHDHDPGFRWYTMPVAEGTLEKLRNYLDEEVLMSILLNLADALDIAHKQELIHRDISPSNILALSGGSTGKFRWVLADWGMVRHPPEMVSKQLTRTGQGMGTPGFDAPELDDDPRTVTTAVDVYSLGRVTAWFVTGNRPLRGRRLLPDGTMIHWRPFVTNCAHEEVAHRVPDMAGLKELLRGVISEREESPDRRARNLVDDLLRGAVENLDSLVSLAEAYTNNTDLYIDHLARVPTMRLYGWAANDPDRAAALATTMAEHVVGSPWGDRDRQYAGTPLSFVHTVLRALVDVSQLGLAQDLATPFFTADARWQDVGQRMRTRDWLDGLTGPAAAAMARALAHCADKAAVSDHYREGGWQPAAAALRAAMTA